MEGEPLKPQILQLFLAIDELGILINERKDNILDGDGEFVMNAIMMRFHMEQSTSAICKLEDKVLNLGSLSTSESVQIRKKMDHLGGNYAVYCLIFHKRHQWLHVLSMVKGEDDWIAERKDFLGENFNSLDSIEAYVEACTKLGDFWAQLCIHKKNVNMIKAKASTFPGGPDKVKDRILSITKKLEQFRKSIAGYTEAIISDLTCLTFILKAFELRQKILELEPKELEKESVVDYNYFLALLKEHDEFNLELKGLVAEFASLKQMMTELVIDLNYYSGAVVRTIYKLGCQMEELMSSRGERIRGVYENYTKIRALNDQIVGKFDDFTKLLERLRKRDSLKVEELVQIGDSDIIKLEALVEELETLKGEHAPRYRKMIDSLKQTWYGEKVNIDGKNAGKEFLVEWAERVAAMLKWIAITRFTILNGSGSKEEQEQQTKRILAEMDSQEVELNRIQELDGIIQKLFFAQEECTQAGPGTIKLLQEWDELKLLISEARNNDRLDNAEPDEEKISNAPEMNELDITKKSDPIGVAEVTEAVGELNITSDGSVKHPDPEPLRN